MKSSFFSKDINFDCQFSTGHLQLQVNCRSIGPSLTLFIKAESMDRQFHPMDIWVRGHDTFHEHCKVLLVTLARHMGEKICFLVAFQLKWVEAWHRWRLPNQISQTTLTSSTAKNLLPCVLHQHQMHTQASRAYVWVGENCKIQTTDFFPHLLSADHSSERKALRKNTLKPKWVLAKLPCVNRCPIYLQLCFGGCRSNTCCWYSSSSNWRGERLGTPELATSSVSSSTSPTSAVWSPSTNLEGNHFKVHWWRTSDLGLAEEASSTTSGDSMSCKFASNIVLCSRHEWELSSEIGRTSELKAIVSYKWTFRSWIFAGKNRKSFGWTG